MKVWLAVTFNPRGCNDQPQFYGVYAQLGFIYGVYADKARGMKAVETMEGKNDIVWKKDDLQMLYFYKGEDGEDDFPVGSVFSMTVNAKPSYDVVL